MKAERNIGCQKTFGNHLARLQELLRLSDAGSERQPDARLQVAREAQSHNELQAVPEQVLLVRTEDWGAVLSTLYRCA